jgi:hypothetical protein
LSSKPWSRSGSAICLTSSACPSCSSKGNASGRDQDLAVWGRARRVTEGACAGIRSLASLTRAVAIGRYCSFEAWWTRPILSDRKEVRAHC